MNEAEGAEETRARRPSPGFNGHHVARFLERVEEGSHAPLPDFVLAELRPAPPPTPARMTAILGRVHNVPLG